jgi:hypothetical protein
LIREDAIEQKQAGVIELLNLPARFSRVHPYLCGLALAEASMTLRSLNDPAGADVLARELATTYPSHPVSDWAPIRAARPKTPAPAAPAAKTDPPPETPSPPAK